MSARNGRSKWKRIRAALVEGEQSGIAEDSSLEGILAELRASRAREQTGLLP